MDRSADGSIQRRPLPDLCARDTDASASMSGAFPISEDLFQTHALLAKSSRLIQHP